MPLIALHHLPARQQQPEARLPRALTMDPSQHTGIGTHGFAGATAGHRKQAAQTKLASQQES